MRTSLQSLMAILLLSTACGQALAQVGPRPIPEDAKRGTIRYEYGMTVAIGGNATQLAPGALIRNQNNLIIVPSALPPAETLADYTVDATGQVTRVWLLTPAEAARPRKPAAQR